MFYLHYVYILVLLWCDFLMSAGVCRCFHVGFSPHHHSPAVQADVDTDSYMHVLM